MTIQEIPYLGEYKTFLQGLQQATEVGIDSETTGLSVKSGDDYLRGFSLAFKAGGMYFSEYFPVRHEEDNVPKPLLSEIFEALSGKLLVFHNRKFDLHSFMTMGVDLSEWASADTLLLAQLINEERPYLKSLDNLAKMYIKEGKVDRDKVQDYSKLFGWDKIPASILRPYAKGDAEVTLKLYYKLKELFDKEYTTDADRLLDIEIRMNTALFHMEQRGVGVDLAFCKQYSGIANLEMALIESELGFTPSKSTALSKFLFGTLGLPILETTPTGKPKMDKHVMEEYERMLSSVEDHRAQLVLNYRGWQKANGTFYLPFQQISDSTGKIHANFKQHGTVTGRLSCEQPNLQQIPRTSDKIWNGRIRSAFRASTGFRLVGFDYSQLEFRLAAAYGNEQWLIREFNERDSDVFTALAERINTDRYTAKTFTYALIYGAGKEKIAKLLNKKVEEIEEIYTNFLNTIPGIIKAKTLAGAKAGSRGYLRYWSGRRRHFHDRNDSYKGFNSLLQGGSAEVVKSVLILVAEEVCDENCRLLLQVHDELVFEIKEELVEEYSPKIISIMEGYPTEKFGVLFTVAGKLWGEAE